MRKYMAVPLTCAFAMMALTGCTDPSTLYENNDLVSQERPPTKPQSGHRAA